MSPAFPPLAQKALEAQGVELILNERVTDYVDGKVKLSSKPDIECDLYIPCKSTGANSSFVPPTSADKNGYIKVNDYLQVEGLDHAFAIGDVSNRDIKTFTKVHGRNDQ